jgi:hypothetical protein
MRSAIAICCVVACLASLVPMNEQHDNLLEVFIKWKGNPEQVDDVLIIGVKY